MVHIEELWYRNIEGEVIFITDEAWVHDRSRWSSCTAR
jgi:hypothetical protein